MFTRAHLEIHRLAGSVDVWRLNAFLVGGAIRGHVAEHCQKREHGLSFTVNKTWCYRVVTLVHAYATLQENQGTLQATG